MRGSLCTAYRLFIKKKRFEATDGDSVLPKTLVSVRKVCIGVDICVKKMATEVEKQNAQQQKKDEMCIKKKHVK